LTEFQIGTDHLIGLFNEEKLKKISSRIIEAYRKSDEKALKHFATAIGISSDDVVSKPAGTFRKMMLFYHPDRMTLIHKKIRDLALAGQTELLKKMEKSVTNDYSPKKKKPKGDDFVFRKEYWKNPFNDNFESEDFLYTHEDRTRVSEEDHYEFIEAVRAMMYGNLPGEFLPKDLYHLDGELNLSEEGIGDLSGLEFCINVSELVLSRNRISHLADISTLTQLQSLDLSRNHISYVDELAALNSLRILDLSFNEIEDISPLTELEELKYLNIIGNPLTSSKPLRILRNRGVMVIGDTL
jgi:Leucine-rich repeat (LRR) protein